jgi:O-antigen ligase
VIPALSPACLAALTAAAAVTVVPGHFNLFGASAALEGDKALLLRSLALILAGGVVVTACFRPGPLWRAPDWSARQPVVIAALALIAASTLATLFSIAPALSWWGTYERRLGLLTLLSDAAVFVAILSFRGQRRVIDALVDALIVGSILPTLYGCFELWTHPTAGGQITGTVGNPGFLASYLIVVWPYTAARVIEQWRRQERSLAIAAAYAGLLGCQTLALLSTGSRAPVLGLIVALGATAVLYLRHLRRGRGVLAALLAAAIVVTGVFMAANRELSPGRVASRIAASETARLRVVIWADALRALRDRPSRLLAGHGAETTAQVIGPFQSPNVAWLEGSYGRLDRAHNLWLDALLTSGLVGSIALLALWLAAFRTALRRLAADRDDLLVAAILTSLVAHLVNVQFHFETVVTSMLFWFTLGLLAALDAPPLPANPAGQGAVLARLRLFLAVAPVLVLVFDSISIDALQARGLHLTPLVLPVAVLGAAVVVVRTPPVLAGMWWRCTAAALVSAIVGFGVLRNIDAARAMVFAGHASELARLQQWQEAERWYAAAARAEPAESTHADALALVLLQKARTTADEPARLDALRRALSLAERWSAPTNAESMHVLAQTHLTWAELAASAPARADHLGAADTAFSGLAERRPVDPSVWSLWAQVDLARGNFPSAAEKVNHAFWLRRRPQTP